VIMVKLLGGVWRSAAKLAFLLVDYKIISDFDKFMGDENSVKI